ncbi:MAG: hypothetical protein QM767_11275 [Anaeromyxobacter sp.]
MTRAEAEEALRRAEGSLAIDGLQLTGEEREQVLLCLCGKSTEEELVAWLVNRVSEAATKES